VRITTVEFLTGLVFPTVVRLADALRYAAAGEVPATPAGAGAAGIPSSQRRVTPRLGGAIMSPSDIFL